MVNKSELKEKVKLLGLTDKQAEIYLLLLKHGLTTPLELSRQTTINRTTIYRVLEDLQKLNLIEEVLDSRGAKIKAVKPENLSLLLTQKEAELNKLKSNLSDLINDLSVIKDQPANSTQVVYFRGQTGLKQLLWNTLKAKIGVVGYGFKDWNVGVGKEFAEKIRQEYINRNIKSLELLNILDQNQSFTDLSNYKQVYEGRMIPRSVIEIKHDTYIYNDVFAFYHFYQRELFGIEIHNAEIAKTQKQIFEMLWKMGKK